jgi:hypothetical protein
VGSLILIALSYHPLPNRQTAIRSAPRRLNPIPAARHQTAKLSSLIAGHFMRQFILLLLAASLWPVSSQAQQCNQLGPLCNAEATPADQQIDACNKTIALKVFAGEKLATSTQSAEPEDHRDADLALPRRLALAEDGVVRLPQTEGNSSATDTLTPVIPGRCEASNPESLDSGFALTRAPE